MFDRLPYRPYDLGRKIDGEDRGAIDQPGESGVYGLEGVEEKRNPPLTVRSSPRSL